MQLGFRMIAERTGRRTSIYLLFRTPPDRLSTTDLDQVLQSIVLQNPALACRIRFSRGIAYQEWTPGAPEFAELNAESEEAALRRVREVTDEFEASLDGPAMSVRLIRSTDGDHLLLIFDHAMVDEHSLLLIRRQLDTPAYKEKQPWARYEAAVHDRAARETTAANGPGTKFWADRLEASIGELPREIKESARSVPAVSLPSVSVPSSFHGSLFPYVLFSVHRALRDVAGPGPTLVGYPWGERNGTFYDVVGCFMNTVISLDMTRSEDTTEAVGDFLNAWFREIDHADVPFAVVSGLGSAIPWSVTAFVSYTHGRQRTVNIAGTQAVEISTGYARPNPGSAFTAAAQVRDDEVHPHLFIDQETVRYQVRELGTRWCHWLSKALWRFPDGQL
jgi:hypothetical protein